MPLRDFSDEDWALIQFMIAETRRNLQGFPSRPLQEQGFTEAEDHQAPEIYIARPVDEAVGIPALEVVFGADDIPGKALCDIYTIDEFTIDAPTIASLHGIQADVYNISTSPLSGDRWYIAERTKSGKWVAEAGGSGDVLFQTGTGTGTGSFCHKFTGFDFGDLDIVGDDFDPPDYLLGVRDGCLVRVAVVECDVGTGTTPTV